MNGGSDSNRYESISRYYVADNDKRKKTLPHLPFKSSNIIDSCTYDASPRVLVWRPLKESHTVSNELFENLIRTW